MICPKYGLPYFSGSTLKNIPDRNSLFQILKKNLGNRYNEFKNL